MEAKLKEYRAIRRRKELIENAKEKYEKSKEKLVNFLVPKVIQDMSRVYDDDDVYDDADDREALLKKDDDAPKVQPIKQTNRPIHPIQPIEHITDIASETSDVESLEENEESWRHCLIRWGVYAIIWMGFWAIFLQLQFGAVYFVLSVLIGIYLNTRTRPKKKGEVSAYSVFNENCVSINGTLTPEQFEREIRFGSGTVRSF